MNRGIQAHNPKTTRRRWLWWLAAVVVIAAIAGVAWRAVTTPRGAGLLETFPVLLQDLPKDEQPIGQIILSSYKEYRADARNWSAAYFGCLFFSAALSALAGLVIKLQFFMRNEDLKKDLAAALAASAALLITLSTVGDFQVKWRANRVAAARMEALAYAFMTEDRKAHLQSFSSRIQAISYERNLAITSDDGGWTKGEEQRQAPPPAKAP